MGKSTGRSLCPGGAWTPASPARPPDQGALLLQRPASTSTLHLPTGAAPAHHPAGGPGAASGTVPGSLSIPTPALSFQVLQMELAILMERIRGYTMSREAQTALGTVDVTFWDPFGKGANRSRPSNWPPLCFLCSRPDAIPKGAGVHGVGPRL